MDCCFSVHLLFAWGVISRSVMNSLLFTDLRLIAELNDFIRVYSGREHFLPPGSTIPAVANALLYCVSFV